MAGSASPQFTDILSGVYVFNLPNLSQYEVIGQMIMTSSMDQEREKTLKQLHSIYAESNGLIECGRKLGHQLFEPRRKMNILLVGNHSSGKSSFINWYVGQKIQKTGVAIETQGFTFVTAGRMRETLTGESAIRLFPYLKRLESMKGFVSYLNAELIVPTSSNRLNLVSLIDTPGLADGELHYPFDINKSLVWMGSIADLIFVFFDPIGQALCKRTLDIVEQLNALYSSRMRFFLSKADEAGDDYDRQKIMMQIVQELCERPGLNQSGFDMLTIYLPDQPDLRLRERMCVNQIDDACREIDKTVGSIIQNTFVVMERDIKNVFELIDKRKRQTLRNLPITIDTSPKDEQQSNYIESLTMGRSLFKKLGLAEEEESTTQGLFTLIFETYMTFITMLAATIEKRIFYSSILFSLVIIITIYIIVFRMKSIISPVRWLGLSKIRSDLERLDLKREQLYANYLRALVPANVL
ncbi:hypothetical protein DERF_002761 [Dermatophagoides farinae]|uniref:Dynamin N-terminal domain-containing protein n=1 Tax=Dermatophagoides farinae TaxID=6954 RepID=A0A922IEB6_DERFA|nr:hypothetical protein DERF_002761 [Dermatophagoides farinae]